MRYQRNFGIEIRKFATFTRPANTTAYAAGDVINNSTSAPTALEIKQVSFQKGSGGTILDVIMIDSANQSVAGLFNLWLFNAPRVTLDNDNDPFTPTDAELDALQMVIPLNIYYSGDKTAGAGGNRIYQTDGIYRQFRCAPGSFSLYAELVAENAYTPVSGETFTIELRAT